MVSGLEEMLFRLEIVAFSAEIEVLRMPSHQFLLTEIAEFRRQTEEVAAFFQTIAGDLTQVFSKTKDNSAQAAIDSAKYRNIALQGNMLLFYLKGEIQKLAAAS